MTYRNKRKAASLPLMVAAIVAGACFLNVRQAVAADGVTVFLLDKDFQPVVRLEKVAPLQEGLRAILAMYALQNGGGCTGYMDCVLSTALGIGPQCSDAHLRLVRAWFKSSIPQMSGYAPVHYLNIQRPDELEDMCYGSGDSATFQQTWDRIRVEQNGAEISVDAVGSWLAREETGKFHYRTIYKVEDHSITVLSHVKVAGKDEEKRERRVTD